MANNLVMLTVTEDGEEISIEKRKWCLSVNHGSNWEIACCNQILDTEVDAKWEKKSVQRGGITCPKCLEIIKFYKSIKL